MKTLSLNLKKKKIWLFILLISLLYTPVFAQEGNYLYHRAVEFAKSGDSNSAFMCFRSYLENSPKSKYKEAALFASGEYYFEIGDDYDAGEVFIQLISDYPDSKAKLFAYAYLMKIAQRRGNEPLAKELENIIINSKQHIFLFKSSRIYKYQSPLLKKYKLIYYIDKIEFYLNGELFAKISY